MRADSKPARSNDRRNAGGGARAGASALSCWLRPAPGWQAASALLTGVAGAGLLAYAGRGAIGASIASGWLVSHGVPASIQVERLDATGFTGAVRLGAANNPDFASDHVELAFTPALTLKAARIVAPVLRLRFDGRRLDFGALQPLVDQALAAKPSSAPGPDVTIERGLLFAATAYGPVQATVDGRLSAGRLVSLRLGLPPTRLGGGALQAEAAGGGLTAVGIPGGLRARFGLHGLTLRQGAAAVEAASVEGTADIATRGLAPSGRLKLEANLRATRAGTARASLAAPVVRGLFDGSLTGPLDRLALSGRATLSGEAASARAGGVAALRPQLTLESGDLQLARTGERVKLDGDLGLVLRAAEASGPNTRATRLAARGRLDRVRAVWSRGGLTFDSPGTARLTSADVRLGSVQLLQVSTEATGAVTLAAKGRARFAGRLQLAGASPAAQSRRWAAGLPLGGPELARALAQARVTAADVRLSAGGGERPSLVVAGPIRVEGAGGARLTGKPRGPAALLSWDGRRASGGGDLAADGGGLPSLRLSPLRYDLGRDPAGLSGQVEAAFALAPYSRGEVRGLAADGAVRMQRQAGALTATLGRCASFSLAGYGRWLADASARLCPTTDPLLRLAGERWAASARVQGVRAALPEAQVALSGAATLQADNRAGAAGAEAVVADLSARDLASERRFEPLAASGRIALKGAAWNGGLTLATGTGRSLGTATLRATADLTAGSVALDTGRLAFAQDGLQPRSISPLAPNWFAKVDGAARFTGALAWAGGKLTGAGRLETTGLDFTGPLGRVTKLRGTVDLASLAPLTTPPVQALSAESVAWITPLRNVRVRFQLAPEAVRLEAAQAAVAGGTVSLDPTTVGLKPDATTRGVLRLTSLDAGALLADSSLADKLKLQAKLSGALPFAVGPEGVRIGGGRLAADGPGRISLSRAALTGAEVQTSGVQDLAYQALEDLAFDRLDAAVDSQPKGRLGVLLHINGRHDPPRAVEARIGLFDLLGGHALDRKLPLPSGTPVNLTLDTSLNFDDLLAAYLRTGQRSAGVHGGTTK